jgi:superfamily II DNA/RNA helicase
MTLSSFGDLGLPANVVDALSRAGITEPTPVQAAVLPDAMAGHDVLGRAQTGSGKTLAFGLPVIARLAGEKSRFNRPRAIIIVPTRELATQVRRSMEPLAFAAKLKLATIYGGTPYDRQIKALRQGVDIVVATPGRLEDLINRGSLRTDDVQIIVLDEADHLCDLGFYPVVDGLLDQTPAEGQRLLLSATLDGDVDKLVRKHLRNPKTHKVDPSAGSVTTMDHHVMVVGGFNDKIDAVTALVEANDRTIVFVKTREGATELRDSFEAKGIEAVDLHGNLSQRVRERNLHKFSKGDAKVVVATDVAARGIHVDGVGLVVHFDAPTDPKAYLHRSGRTARAGESGAVVTLTVRKRFDEVRRLQKSAGVEAKHHDIRTAPRPMTTDALGRSVGTTFEAEAPRSSGYGQRSTYGQRKPYGARTPAPRTGSWKDRNERPARDGERPARREWTNERPARDERTERPARREWSSERPVRDEGTERPARRTAPPAKKFEGKYSDKPAAKKPTPKHEGASRPAGSATHKSGAKARWSGAEKRSR